MKQFVYGFIFAIVSIIGLGSCTEEAFDIDKVNKQTILVFLPWTGGNSSIGLTEALSNNIDSICAGIKDKKGLNNTRVLVFFSNNANNSTLFDLTYNDVTKEVSRTPIKTYEGSAYNSANGFADILNEVRQNAEALNYALIIGAHGCGWSCADDWINYPNQAKSFNTQQTLSYDTPFSGIQFGTDPDNPTTRFFGSVDCKENSIDLSTLVEGIKQSGIKMQYILFDVCYMGNVETAYELKDVTNYLVASSSEIMAKGIPYRSMWSYLNVTASMRSQPNGITPVHKGLNKLLTKNILLIQYGAYRRVSQMRWQCNEKKSDQNIHLMSHFPDFHPATDGLVPTYDISSICRCLRPNGYSKANTSKPTEENVVLQQYDAHTAL